MRSAVQSFFPDVKNTLGLGDFDDFAAVSEDRAVATVFAVPALLGRLLHPPPFRQALGHSFVGLFGAVVEGAH